MNGTNNLPPGWGGDSNAQSPWAAAPQSPAQQPTVPQPTTQTAAPHSSFRQPSAMPQTTHPNMHTPPGQTPALTA